MSIFILMIGILILTVLILLGLIYYVYKQRKEGVEKEVDYRGFLFVGFIWIPLGVVFMIVVNIGIGISLLGFGIVYLAIGLGNKDKWKKGK